MDWKQLWEILSAPDNVPIIAMIPLLGFYIYLAWSQAHANDLLIEQLKGDAALAKTHHRKAWPFQVGWQKEVHVWPFLLRVEFLAAIIVTIILMVWSITLNAPLEEPANPNLTMNPAKAPWYFTGLQELLHYFPPFVAGIILPVLIVSGLFFVPFSPFFDNVKTREVLDWLRSRAVRWLTGGILIAVISALLIRLHAWDALLPLWIFVGLTLFAAVGSAMNGNQSRSWLLEKPISFWIMTLFLMEAVVLTAVGTFFRGPGWAWVWPWRV